MITTKRILRIILWSILVFFIVINTVFWGVTLLLGNTTTHDEINDIFVKNKEYFNELSQCFFQNNMDALSINADDYRDKLHCYGEGCVTTAEILFEHTGVKRINKEGDCLYVLVGSAKDYVQGIVYLNNGEFPRIKNVDRLVFSVLEPNWYYYEIVD